MRRNLANLAVTHPIVKSNVSLIIEKVAALESTTFKAIMILDDLLLCQQLEANTLDMDLKEVNPFNAAKNALRDLHDKISIEPLTDDDGCANKLRLICDETKLQLALNKLLHIAVVKSEEAHFRIRFSFEMDPSVSSEHSLFRHFFHNQVCPLIRKTGVFSIFIWYGSTQEDVKRIEENVTAKRLVFEREAEFDDRASRLDLWISKHLIELQDGCISVRWNNGEIEYHVEFPVQMIMDEETPEVPPNQRGSIEGANSPREISSSQSRLRRKTMRNFRDIFDRTQRILIVDDSKMVRKVMGNLMSSLGHTFQEASDGAEAVEMVRQSVAQAEPFDLILMDNQMPRMMGHEATQVIRTELRYSGMILGVTGNALAEDIRSFIDHGADMVILKPLTEEKFNQAISSLRDKKAKDVLLRATSFRYPQRT